MFCLFSFSLCLSPSPSLFQIQEKNIPNWRHISTPDRVQSFPREKSHVEPMWNWKSIPIDEEGRLFPRKWKESLRHGLSWPITMRTSNAPQVPELTKFVCFFTENHVRSIKRTDTVKGDDDNLFQFPLTFFNINLFFLSLLFFIYYYYFFYFTILYQFCHAST